MTLIDKAALLNRIATEVHYDSEHSLEMYAKLLSEINDAPTVDAEPVVRCKDCRFYLQSNERCELVDTRLRFYETDKNWTGDCFCSWGERR